MNYKYKISTSVNLDEWNNLLKKSGYSSFFQTAQNIVSKPNDTLPFFIMVLDQNEEIKGQLALNIIKTSVMYSSKFLRTLNKMISKITSRIIWVYGPIIHSTNFLQNKTKQLEFFNSNKKNDDFADSLLQGLYYIKKNKLF